MPAFSPDPQGALRRSRTRLRVLLALDDAGETYQADLARGAGVRDARVRAALVGGRGFRADASLVALGLAREVRHRDLRLYRITPKGTRLARELRERGEGTLVGADGLWFGLLPRVP